MIPLVTLDPLPLKDAAGADLTWRPQLLSTLQTVARETAALVGRVSTEGGAQAVDCWYQAPGSTDAIGVDVDSFIKKPFFVGLYFLRVRTGAGDPAHYRCSPTEGGDANARYVEANIDARRIEALLAELAEERTRSAALVTENTNLRAHVNDVLDREAKTRRELAEAQAALVGAEEERNPLFDEAGVGGILTMGDKWFKEFVEGGEEGRASGLLGVYFASDFHLVGKLASDVDAMTLIRARYAPQWNHHAEAFNVVSATLAKADGRSAAHALRSAEEIGALLPSARAAARERRERQIDDARKLLAKSAGTAGRGKGRGGDRGPEHGANRRARA